MQDINARYAAFFIDGFNVYHFLKTSNDNVMWLDYMALCQAQSPIDVIASVNYYSARAHWDNGKIIRHNNYIKALEDTGVKVRMSSFADKEKIGHMKNKYGRYRVTYFNDEFSAHRRQFYTREEKQTDVAIGVDMYRIASKGGVNKIVLLSNDTDMVPALKRITEDFPGIRIKVYAPVREGAILPSAIRGIISKKHHKYLNYELVKNSQFADPLTLSDGTILRKPQLW